jgi:hypothetical protein
MHGTHVDAPSTRSRQFWKAVRGAGYAAATIAMLSTWVVPDTVALVVVVGGAAVAWTLILVASRQLRRSAPTPELRDDDLRVKARVGSGQNAAPVWVVCGDAELVLIGRAWAHEVVSIPYEKIACAQRLQLNAVITRGVLLAVHGRDGVTFPLMVSKPDAERVMGALDARSVRIHDPGSINGVALNLGLRGPKRQLTDEHEPCRAGAR